MYRVSIWDDEKFLEMDNSDDCTTEYIECHLTVYLQMVKIINFMLCMFYNNKNYKTWKK